MIAAQLLPEIDEPAYVRTGGYRRLAQRFRTAARRLTGPSYISEQAARRSSARREKPARNLGKAR